MIHIIRTLILSTVILIIMCMPHAYAQNETPCDPQIWDAIKSRAWLETQREIAQNQNLIFKPDSVLEYTCFDQLLLQPARNFPQARPFSETDWFNGHPATFSNTTTDEAIALIVGASTIRYLRNNFPDKYLNDRGTGNYAATASINVPATIYNCDEMAKVWNSAKCMNFVDDETTDGFFDFPWYVDNDPRQRPPSFDACEPPGTLATPPTNPNIPKNLVEKTIREAFNQKEDMYTLDPEPPFRDGQPYLQDPVITNLDKILPPGVPGGPNGCALSHEIYTGVYIDRPDTGQYEEVVCTNPGCAYNPVNGACQ